MCQQQLSAVDKSPVQATERIPPSVSYTSITTAITSTPVNPGISGEMM